MNASAALVTRGVNEVQRLAINLGARSSTLTGLSGVGDTFGTCFGPLSRNRTLGMRLGRGETVEEILASMAEVAEGYATTFSLVEMIEKLPRAHRAERTFPIIYNVKCILDGSCTPQEGVRRLMDTKGRVELWNL
ncbi:glycerol-3-phosphate dehydrogenase [Nannochloropsis gaditana]|nr:glycerol-3-phosphate dehydrogenase [Nannochloropsis gaditana]